MKDANSIAYITKSNAAKIISTIDVSDTNITGQVYAKDIKFLSNRDKQKLLRLRQLYQETEVFVNNKYKKLIPRPDKFEYIYEGGTAAFHYSKDCPTLNTAFVNYEIPKVIKDKGAHEIRRFRTWFRTNEHLMQTPDVFVMRMSSAFGIRGDFKPIIIESSGVQAVDNYSLEEIVNKIDALITERDQYYIDANDRKRFVIKEFEHRLGIAYTETKIIDNKTGYKDQTIKNFLRKYYEHFTKSLIPLLQEYYRLSSNPDLGFDKKLLEELGFRKCLRCHVDE